MGEVPLERLVTIARLREQQTSEQVIQERTDPLEEVAEMAEVPRERIDEVATDIREGRLSPFERRIAYGRWGYAVNTLSSTLSEIGTGIASFARNHTLALSLFTIGVVGISAVGYFASSSYPSYVKEATQIRQMVTAHLSTEGYAKQRERLLLIRVFDDVYDGKMSASGIMDEATFYHQALQGSGYTVAEGIELLEFFDSLCADSANDFDSSNNFTKFVEDSERYQHFRAYTFAKAGETYLSRLAAHKKTLREGLELLRNIYEARGEPRLIDPMPIVGEAMHLLE